MDEKREIRLGGWQIKHQPNLNAKKTVEQIKETYTHSEDWQEFEVLLNRITELENQNSNRLDAIVKPEIAEIVKIIDKLEKDVTVNVAPLTTIGKSLIEGYTKALQHLRNEIRKQFSV